MLIANELLAANKINSIKDNNKSIKKYRKLSKVRKLVKGLKLFKSQKLAKSRKKLSKSENLSNFDTKKNKPSFFTFDAKTIFNCLWLAFIKALIFRHFDLKYYIWIEAEVSSYTIDNMLNQLVFATWPNKVIIKTYLSLRHLGVFFLRKFFL